MALYLYTSNRLENLAAAFADYGSAYPLPPMAPETVVVQSGGMARWLNMQLAERLGVSANLVFPFPNGFIDQVYAEVLPKKTLLKMLDKRVLHWQLMRVLPELLARPDFAILADYLAGNRGLKRYQLAGRLSDLFDQYLIFRPEMILEWEAGRGDTWQASLWQELSGRSDCLAGIANRAQLQRQCLEILARPDLVMTSLPPRFAVFGLSTIPPYYLQIFTALAKHLDGHFFFLNPCREYWGDIVSARTIDRLSLAGGDLDDLYLTQGNPLLASTGLQGRELFGLLLECDFGGERELFVEPAAAGQTGMLASVQTDILNLRDGSPGPGEFVDAADHSIMVHSCHSPMREIEVLHDQILAMFEADPELEAKDIIVMTPDIESYGPLIGAVFGSRKVIDGRALSFTIADRVIKKEGVLFATFLQVLALAGSRLEIGTVLGLLEREPVRRRFNLSLVELERVEKWLAAVNIRWGIDGADRQGTGLPATYENTWRFGIDRLLLGYAMVGENQRDFAGILPYDDLEGGEVEALGRFLDFSETLFAYVRKLDEKRTLAGWSELLLGLFNDLIAVSDGQEHEQNFIARTLAGFARVQAEAAYQAEVEFEVIMAELDQAGQTDSLTSGFMAGGITFCEMLPMRAVPFKVVCLLGMNDGAYPRPAAVPAFDLIAATPRLGDRSRRKDDRYLFLESILSARQCLYLSYVGQSVRDGSYLSPSVLVSELVEYLGRRFSVSRERFLTVHPLQPFSPAYFSGEGKLFSFSKSNFAAARMLVQPKRDLLLVPEPLPAPPDEFREVSLDELIFFFANPARYFCQKRLGIYLEGDVGELVGSENFSLDFLDRYRLGETMLRERLAGKSVADYFRVARQQGILPHGKVARATFGELAQGVEEVVGRLAAKGAGGKLADLQGEVALGSYVVFGQLQTSPEYGLIVYRFAKLKASDQIRGWLSHLLLDCLAPAGCCRTTQVAGSDNIISFPPVADSKGLLADILDLYRQGLQSPLRFFPTSSLEYAEVKGKGKPESEALLKARKKWQGSSNTPAEGDDRYYQLCYRGLDPFGPEMSASARAFFDPLLAGRRN